MNTAVINIKTEEEVKLKAQKIAKELGLSLSGIINAYLKQLIKTKTVVFSATSEESTEWALKMLKESREDVKAGRVSPSFSEAKSAIEWLKKQK